MRESWATDFCSLFSAAYFQPSHFSGPKEERREERERGREEEREREHNMKHLQKLQDCAINQLADQNQENKVKLVSRVWLTLARLALTAFSLLCRSTSTRVVVPHPQTLPHDEMITVTCAC